MTEKLKLIITIEYDAESQDYDGLTDPSDMADTDFNQFQELLEKDSCTPPCMKTLSKFLTDYFGQDQFSVSVSPA